MKKEIRSEFYIQKKKDYCKHCRVFIVKGGKRVYGLAHEEVFTSLRAAKIVFNKLVKQNEWEIIERRLARKQVVFSLPILS